MTNERIEKRKRELLKEIEEARVEYNGLLNEQHKNSEQELKCLVGMCFEYGGQAAVIIDVPKPVHTTKDTYFNPYRLPCLLVGNRFEDYDLIPFEEDTIFSKAIDSNNAFETFTKERNILERQDFLSLFVGEVNQMLSKLFPNDDTMRVTCKVNSQ